MLANAREDYVFRIVDPAVVPIDPTRPNALFLIFLGTFVGGFLGLVAVVIRQIAKGFRQQDSARDAA